MQAEKALALVEKADRAEAVQEQGQAGEQGQEEGQQQQQQGRQQGQGLEGTTMEAAGTAVPMETEDSVRGCPPGPPSAAASAAGPAGGQQQWQEQRRQGPVLAAIPEESIAGGSSDDEGGGEGGGGEEEEGGGEVAAVVPEPARPPDPWGYAGQPGVHLLVEPAAVAQLREVLLSHGYPAFAFAFDTVTVGGASPGGRSSGGSLALPPGPGLGRRSGREGGGPTRAEAKEAAVHDRQSDRAKVAGWGGKAAAAAVVA